MPALDLEGKVCPRHPAEPAVARCFSCFKPICGECLVIANNHDFCSQQCAEAHAKTSKSFEQFEEAERRARRRRLIRRLSLIVLFLGVGYVAISYWVNNPDEVSTLFTTIKESIVGVVDSIKETVQGFTGG